jgi:2-dehydro-3-deoxygluconokinase
MFFIFGEAMAMFIANKPGSLHEMDNFTRELAIAYTNVAIGLRDLTFVPAGQVK